MERIDKVIGSQTEYSRKDIKKLILQKRNVHILMRNTLTY